MGLCPLHVFVGHLDSCFCVCVCVLLGLHLPHMEVPKLGVKSELPLPAYATATATATGTPDPSCVCDLHHGSRQRQILNPLSEARDRTASSWTLVGFVNHWAMMRTPKISSSVKYLTKTSVYFLSCLFFFLCTSSLFWRQALYFLFSCCGFWWTEFLNLNINLICHFFPPWLVLFVSCLRPLCTPGSSNSSSIFPCKSRSSRHMELTSVDSMRLDWCLHVHTQLLKRPSLGVPIVAQR